MTLDEATKAAVQRLPVICSGITYTRILRTGYRYDEQGRWFPFVDMVSACGHSLTTSDPKWVTLAGNKDLKNGAARDTISERRETNEQTGQT